MHCLHPGVSTRWPLIAIVPSVFFVISLLTPLQGNTAPNASTRQTEPAGNAKSIEYNDKGIHALSQNNAKVAEELFKKALEIDAGNLTAAFNLAGALVVNKKKDQALVHLQRYTKNYPVDAGLFSRYADILFSSGKIKEAVENYEKAFALDKQYSRITAKLGLGYALLNRLDESEQMYLAAVTTSPKDPALLGNLSSTLLANGKPEKAIATAKEALRLAPQRDVYVTLGSAYEAQRQLKDALGSYKRAVELGANSEELTKKITELEKVAS